MTPRDEFIASTKKTLAERVAYRCSNPGCRKPTSAPSETEDKSVIIGVAAHITAAAPGGKRYDSKLTPDQRRHITNGIWLCQSCAKLVDSDEQRYLVPILMAWKQLAEQSALYDVEGKTHEEIAHIVSQIAVVSFNQSGGQIAQTIVNQAPLKRDLTRHVDTIIAALKQYPPESYEIQLGSGDREAEVLARQIDHVLKEAEWQKKGLFIKMNGSYEDGLEIAVKDVTQGTQVLADQLVITGQLEVHAKKYTDAPEHATIRIGRNPKAFVQV